MSTDPEHRRLLEQLQLSSKMRDQFGAKFHDALHDVKLDGRTAFTCWNVLATLVDMLKDLRVSIETKSFSDLEQQLQFQKHQAEDMIEFVMFCLNPRKDPRT